jgi:hypothetical protein
MARVTSLSHAGNTNQRDLLTGSIPVRPWRTQEVCRATIEFADAGNLKNSYFPPAGEAGEGA